LATRGFVPKEEKGTPKWGKRIPHSGYKVPLFDRRKNSGKIVA